MEKSIEMAGSYLRRTRNKYYEAKEHLEKWHYSESISASQECIELSIKAVFLLLQENYPKRHEFKEEEFEAGLKKIPEKLKYLDFPKFIFTLNSG
jgi:HEPN domain-containing protein